VGVPETAGFGGEGADAGRDGEGASGGFAAVTNPGGNLGVGGAANGGVAACPVGVDSNPGGNLGVLAGDGGKLGMGVLALRGGVPSGRDVAGLDGLGALGEGVFCPLPDIVDAWLKLAFDLLVPATFVPVEVVELDNNRTARRHQRKREVRHMSR
jgi:hypothetical protein